MRQVVSRRIDGGALREDNFVNTVGDSVLMNLGMSNSRSQVTAVDLQSSENCAD